MAIVTDFPWWEYYPKINQIEVLYWRGMLARWWWNDFAQELIEYADNNLPLKKVDFYAYNINSNPLNTDWKVYGKRIERLRGQKLSKHPLVVINYDEYSFMVDSPFRLEQVKDWVDAEWARYYGKQPTSRRLSNNGYLYIVKDAKQKMNEWLLRQAA